MMSCHRWPSRSITSVTSITATVIAIFSGNNLLNTRRLGSTVGLTMIRYGFRLLCAIVGIIIKAAVATNALSVNRCIRRLRHVIEQ